MPTIEINLTTTRLAKVLSAYGFANKTQLEAYLESRMKHEVKAKAEADAASLVADSW